MVVGQAVSNNEHVGRDNSLAAAQLTALTDTAVRLALWKGFELTRNGVQVSLSKGAQHLLAFLALKKRAVRRAHLAGTLWGDVPDGRAAGNLRSAIWRLRQNGTELVRASSGHVSLSPQIAVDIDDLERIACLVADPSANLGDVTLEAIPVGGELLPGWDQEWVLLERERHRQILLHVLDGLCERWTSEGHYAKAIRAGLAAVGGEPLRETSRRALIGAFLAEGNPTEAIRQLDDYRRRLKVELDLEPSPRITALLDGGRVTVG